MRVVIDTVVFVRALMNPTSTWGLLLARAPEYTMVTTDNIRREILDTVARDDLQQRLSRLSDLPPIERVIDYLSSAIVVPDDDTVRVSRDHTDDKFFACAAAGHADYIVSEDEDILAIPEYKGAHTIRTTDFLRLLDAALQGHK